VNFWTPSTSSSEVAVLVRSEGKAKLGIGISSRFLC
jgi:hypothetical protein